MVDLKLARLPDRTPIKLAITVMPDLHQALQDYARLYAETYGREEAVVDCGHQANGGRLTTLSGMIVVCR